jgi:hypothetical protein
MLQPMAVHLTGRVCKPNLVIVEVEDGSRQPHAKNIRAPYRRHPSADPGFLPDNNLEGPRHLYDHRLIFKVDLTYLESSADPIPITSPLRSPNPPLSNPLGGVP